MDTGQTGAAIRQIRILRGLTQEEVAEQLGIGGTAYSHWETGRTELRLRDFVRLSLALRIPLGTLLLAVGAPLESSALPVGQWLDSGAPYEQPFETEGNTSRPLSETMRRPRVSRATDAPAHGRNGRFLLSTALLPSSTPRTLVLQP